MTLEEVGHPGALDVRPIMAAMAAVFPDKLFDGTGQVLENLRHVDDRGDDVETAEDSFAVVELDDQDQ